MKKREHGQEKAKPKKPPEVRGEFSAEKLFQTLAKILSRRYDAVITVKLTPKSETRPESDKNRKAAG